MFIGKKRIAWCVHTMQCLCLCARAYVTETSHAIFWLLSQPDEVNPPLDGRLIAVFVRKTRARVWRGRAHSVHQTGGANCVTAMYRPQPTSDGKTNGAVTA